MRTTLAFLSLAICLCLTIAYTWRPDWATAMTLFPAWGWLVFWCLAIPTAKRKLFVYVTGAWLLFGLVHVEEYRSVFRSVSGAPDVAGPLKVATINCSNKKSALLDALRDEPDILLVQESPRLKVINEILQEHQGYRCSYGIDTSIIAKGSIRDGESDMHFQSASVTIAGTQVDVVSLRLSTSQPRVDLWNPSCWQQQRSMRQRQMKEMEAIIQVLSDDAPLIVGGDFNVPQGDRVFTLLDKRLHDTFPQGGRGWCNTILGDFPVLRIDQIWTSRDIRCIHGTARKCLGTDHRLYSSLLTMERTRAD